MRGSPEGIVAFAVFWMMVGVLVMRVAANRELEDARDAVAFAEAQHASCEAQLALKGAR